MRLVFGWLSKAPLDEEVLEAYVRPAIDIPEVRRDYMKVLRGISSRFTEAAARRFDRFPRPVLLVWAEEDPIFRLAFAERLARDFPDARLHTVSDSLAFVPEDRLDFLAKEILSLVAPTSQGETP